MSLRDKFNTEIAPSLKQRLGLKSIMEVPRLQKITINMGCLLYTSDADDDA